MLDVYLHDRRIGTLAARGRGVRFTYAPEDSLGLLGAIGGERPGAVSVWAEAVRPPRRAQYRDLRPADVTALFAPHDR